ncbi:uncharacterized protein LOC114732344 [Neltuma alba]|uniref:uncharacterized protein LOC114730168 n=1 Tax=Neltuma alba TaxID=207710 RepID=UPI0010A44746|nr:uncharacterized protein LOC114730168 [Prosopis alba]XP_028775467.1 uncharacterized protein LOC114732344 [Prosopis alba]
MALQVEGWPLGLLNGRIGLVETGSDFSGSILTASPTSFTHSSPDLESQSPGSLYNEKTTTLGRLVGDFCPLELSQRSTRARTRIAMKPSKDNNKKSPKMKPWLPSLCSKQTTDAVNVKDCPSLRHYLEAERRAAASFRFSHSIYSASHFPPIKRSNSLS